MNIIFYFILFYFILFFRQRLINVLEFSQKKKKNVLDFNVHPKSVGRDNSVAIFADIGGN